MYTAAKRRVREAEKRVERYHFKFITEYVKCLHQDIFKKAEELYNSTRQLYPDGVMDLTKTVEFMQTTTPNKPIPRYYSCRKTTTETSTTREMVLSIPLMVLNKNTSSPPAVSSPQAVSSPPTVSSPQAVSSPPTVSSPQAVSSPPTVSSPPVVSQPLPLSEEVFQQLLKELQQDPDLARILNNFSTHDMDVSQQDPHPLQIQDSFPQDDYCIDGMDDSLYNDLWDIIMQDNATPLEKQLQFY